MLQPSHPCSTPFLTGIRCREPPASYTTIHDELASLVSSSLNTLAIITWDCIKVATASDTNMVQHISIIDTPFQASLNSTKSYHQHPMNTISFVTTCT